METITTRQLTGITAAVVGVIVSRAIFFAWHVLWPGGTQAHPFLGEFRWFYALMSVAAFAALFRYKIDILKVIAASAAVGLVYTYLAGA